jgi:hypothetical protein
MLGSQPLAGSKGRWIGTRKTTWEVVLSSSLIVTRNPSFDKSLLESLTMLSRLPISSTTLSPVLSLLRLLKMH